MFLLFTYIIAFPNLTTLENPIRYREGEENVSLNLEQSYTFPYPDMFQWSKDGIVITNNSRRMFGYPSVVISRIIPSDEGTYTLRATNHFIVSPFKEIGTGSGSFTIEVVCEYHYN